MTNSYSWSPTTILTNKFKRNVKHKNVNVNHWGNTHICMYTN